MVEAACGFIVGICIIAVAYMIIWVERTVAEKDRRIKELIEECEDLQDDLLERMGYTRKV